MAAPAGGVVVSSPLPVEPLPSPSGHPSVNIRLATPADLPGVRYIVEAAYAPYIARIGRRPGPMLDDYASLIATGRVHVAGRADAAEGVLVLIPQTDALLLDNVAVAPAAQGVGIGRTMMEFAERTALAAGYGSIRLYTNEAMSENIVLYARLGYTETHRVEEKGLRRVYMRKALRGLPAR